MDLELPGNGSDDWFSTCFVDADSLGVVEFRDRIVELDVFLAMVESTGASTDEVGTNGSEDCGAGCMMGPTDTSAGFEGNW